MNNICRCKPLLGTFVDISISAPVPDDELFTLTDIAFGEIERIHQMMSFHEKDSELTKINKQAFLAPVAISPDMEKVIGHALLLSALTNGIYDITVANELMLHGGLPDSYQDIEQGSWSDITLLEGRIYFAKNIKLDLGGIAKGYAVDCAVELLATQTTPFSQICINAGGDIRFHEWQEETVSIRHPSPKYRDRFIPVKMQAASVATSAPNYTNKNSLIIDPDTGKPIKTKDSISVFAPTCMIADALTKTLFLKRNSNELLKQFDATAVRIDAKGNITPFSTSS